MRTERSRCRVAFAAVFVLTCTVSGETQDEDVPPETFVIELSGRLSAESRLFLRPGALAGQQLRASGAVAEPTLYVESGAGRSFTLTPFFRYDDTDPRRTHFDLREAYLLLFGDVRDSGGWEARLGFGQVFWGVTESHRLVDVVNQVDLVEHPGGDSKLGQPMAHVTLFGHWGMLEVIALPVHRARTFPGPQGRLRLPAVVDHSRVEYETTPRLWSQDFATRYRHSLGAVDLGISFFRGTSREPYLRPIDKVGTEPVLVQHYEQIQQLGLEVQWTLASWLLKAEVVGRADARNLLGLEEDYVAAVLGGEYTLHASAANATVSLLAEWSYDSRVDAATPGRSPNVLQNDVFVGARLAFDDVQSTELAASLVSDVRKPTRALALEFGRRITNEWSLRAEAAALLSVDEDEFHYAMRRDSFIDVSLSYNF